MLSNRERFIHFMGNILKRQIFQFSKNGLFYQVNLSETIGIIAGARVSICENKQKILVGKGNQLKKVSSLHVFSKTKAEKTFALFVLRFMFYMTYIYIYILC